jgi:hypothetical protein
MIVQRSKGRNFFPAWLGGRTVAAKTCSIAGRLVAA